MVGQNAGGLVNDILGLTTQDPAVKQYITSELKASRLYNATTFLAAHNCNTTVDAAEFAG